MVTIAYYYLSDLSPSILFDGLETLKSRPFSYNQKEGSSDP